MFGELITAMVTPFDKDKKLNIDACDILVDHLISNGSDGILLSGTTGESPTVTDEEKIRMFSYVADNFKGKAKIIAGTGSYDTAHSIELSQKAQETGVDGLLLVTPYYNKPTQEGLYDHFAAIAESVDLPVILYNVPSRTSCNIAANTCIELSKIKNIVGVKEASGDLKQISQIIKGTPDDFLVYSGNDGETLPILSMGGDGVVSVASHIVGKEIKSMIEAFKKGDIKEAKRLHLELLDIFYGIFIVTNPIPIKKALNVMGIDVGSTRLPLKDMDEKSLECFSKILREHRLI